jgi:hypothetical protein
MPRWSAGLLSRLAASFLALLLSASITPIALASGPPIDTTPKTYTPQPDNATCAVTAFGLKESSTSIWAHGYQSCSGNVIEQRQIVDLLRCDYVKYGTCWGVFYTYREVGECYIWWPGGFWCPTDGVIEHNLPAGLYLVHDYGCAWTSGGGLSCGGDDSQQMTLP